MTTLSKVFDYKTQPAWDRSTIVKAIISFSISRQGVLRSGASVMANLFERACEIIKEENSRIFIIPKSEKSELQEALSDLFHHKLIHPVDIESIPLNIRRDYYVYTLDYGYFLQFKKESKLIYAKENINHNLTLDDTDLSCITILASDVCVKTTVCGNCSLKVNMSHKLVKKRNICPKCYEDLI